LLRWVYNLEYKTNRLVKEDVVIFLSLSAKASQKLIQKRVGSKGKRDLVDLDADYQQKVVGVYEQLAKRYGHWRIINCVDRKEELRPKIEVHKEMVRVLQEEKII
jgi:thymidylate kinase